MTLVKFEPMRDLENVFDRVGDFFNQVGKGFTFEVGSFVPRTDIKEDEKNIYIQAELPGLRREDVKIKVSEEGVLTLTGEKRQDYQSGGKKFVRLERTYGKFERSILLPEAVQTDAISASFKDGILEITLPKVEPAAPQEIEISIN